MSRVLGKELQQSNTFPRPARRRVRRRIAVGTVAAFVALAPLSPASAATVSVGGGSASYGVTYSSGIGTTRVTVRMIIKDTVADGFCVHGSVTFNVSLAPDPTYDSPEVCGYGTSRAWTISLSKPLPFRVNGALVKVCKTIASAPDPCGTAYHGR